MSADGSVLTRLTDGPNDCNAAWSPDGTRLAFQRHDETGADIYVMNWDGSDLTRLTSGPETDQDPAWSPDGSRIAFLREGSIHVMNADGSEVMQLTSESAEDFHPSWSPDGSRIVFQRNPYGVGSIHLINPDGSDLTRVAAGQTPSWSPDGRRIIYELFGITVVMSDASGMTRLMSGFAPVWQPVGGMPAEPEPFRSIEMPDGDGQTGPVLATLPQPLRVRVVADDGTPQGNVTLRWNVWWGGAAVHPSLSVDVEATTDADGVSSVSLTLGDLPGPARVRTALVDGTARIGEVLFTATAVPR